MAHVGDTSATQLSAAEAQESFAQALRDVRVNSPSVGI